MRDWVACLAIARALGRTGRRETGELWRTAEPWQRRMVVAHFLSQVSAFAGRIGRLRLVAGPEAFPDSVIERVRKLEEGYDDPP
jgi:hypothetical protein